MISPPGFLFPDAFAARLRALRERLEALAPGQPEGLIELRQELDEAAIEAESLGLGLLAGPLRRIALLTEVWECLALEGSPDAGDVCTFCMDALERMAADTSMVEASS